MENRYGFPKPYKVSVTLVAMEQKLNKI